MSHEMNVAEAFLLTLSSFGVEFIFANPGSEFIPLIDAHAKLTRLGARVPCPVTVPHEALAVAMAHGYYLASGRPQAVMAHVTVGTANALIGLINASRMNVPILFAAGRTPLTESGTNGCRDRFVHWAQESFDQGNMTREFVKWDYEVRLPQSLVPALTRAWSLMQSPPRGPVSLIFAREILLQKFDGEIPEAQPLSPSNMTPSPEDMAQIGTWLATSERALLISARSGLEPQTVHTLEEAARLHALAVLCPQSQAINIRSSHECFIGFENRRALAEADLILVLDTDVPWLPERVSISQKAKVVHVGVDPNFSRIPMRNFRCDLALTASPLNFLGSLVRLPKADGREIRVAWCASLREDFVRAREVLAAQVKGQSRLTGHAVASTLSGLLTQKTLLINELSLPPDLLRLEFPGTYWRSGSASGLGWAMGCGLGAKMARPDLTPITVVGDGVYYLSHPMAAHWMSQARQLPTLTVILNNQGMRSVHTGPEFTDLSPSLAFAEIAHAMGAFGAKVHDREQLLEAMTEALVHMEAGKQGLIEVNLSV